MNWKREIVMYLLYKTSKNSMDPLPKKGNRSRRRRRKKRLIFSEFLAFGYL
jgi:hypothetical protein